MERLSWPTTYNRQGHASRRLHHYDGRRSYGPRGDSRVPDEELLVPRDSDRHGGAGDGQLTVFRPVSPSKPGGTGARHHRQGDLRLSSRCLRPGGSSRLGAFQVAPGGHPSTPGFARAAPIHAGDTRCAWSVSPIRIRVAGPSLAPDGDRQARCVPGERGRGMNTRAGPAASLIFLAWAGIAAAAGDQPAPAMDEAATARFAGLALKCLHAEYPNHISHTMSGDAD